MEHAPSIFGILEPFAPAVIQTLLVCALITVAVALIVGREIRSSELVPSGRPSLRNFLEVLFEAIVGLMRDTIGPGWARYVPLVGTLGLFILISNLMRQIPGSDGPTGYVEPNLSWAIMSFAAAEYVAIKHQGPLNYLRHIAGPAWYVWPITVPVEIVSHLARMLSLTVRLTANMFADHTLIAVFLSIPVVGIFTPWVFAGLGVFVAFLQAFVFTFLTIIYIGQSLEEAHQ